MLRLRFKIFKISFDFFMPNIIKVKIKRRN